MRENSELQRQSEKYRVAALALKQQASALPEVDYLSVEWKKDDAYHPSQGAHFILRSEELHQTKQTLFIKSRQQHQDTNSPYSIANNPMELQHAGGELKKIKRFLVMNGTCASNPTIGYSRNSFV